MTWKSASYEKALEIQPDYHFAWFNRGNALRKMDRYEEAIASYEKALKIQKQMGDRESKSQTLAALNTLYQKVGRVSNLE